VEAHPETALNAAAQTVVSLPVTLTVVVGTTVVAVAPVIAMTAALEPTNERAHTRRDDTAR
jgi:flagellar motor switch/type III secretory pathway protein FliN